MRNTARPQPVARPLPLAGPPAAAPPPSGARGVRAAQAPEAPDGQLLHDWASELAWRHFGRPFTGRVEWAPRLRHRAGDFTPATGRIRLSLPYYRRYGAHEVRAILLHELCHWWLFGQGVRHREDTPAFQSLLRRVGAPRRARPLPRRRRPRRYIYACPRCGARYAYRRRVDYACGRCCAAAGGYDPRFRLRLVASTSAEAAR